MTEWYPDEELRELANLSQDHPSRRAMEARLGKIDLVERQYWTGYLRLTDQLYRELSRVEIPPGLEERLLAVPGQPLPNASSPHGVRRFLDWRWIAACILLVLAGRNALNWYLERQAEPRPLEQAVAMMISRDAVAAAEKLAAPEIDSSDPKQLHDALAARPLPFAPMVLHPRTHASLLGGGVADFHGTPAAYTRWKTPGATYTVFQFDGTKIGVPAKFVETEQSPKDTWPGNDPYPGDHHHVVIWAGRIPPGETAGCTWAAVSDAEDAPDLFGGMVY